ncbi:hypothetical protein SAICODRAFT_30438 [Saitoella complicata NRRL Y-17804]|nr:uncharacterized protein SAICODRAFT_30438 [Saitoella complicata NRRL Y-17804]ODQ53037.1 hypothetical protein SAICODRAFT_30438 [Saitoella complicata NRRL Y-17804]
MSKKRDHIQIDSDEEDELVDIESDLVKFDPEDGLYEKARRPMTPESPKTKRVKEQKSFTLRRSTESTPSLTTTTKTVSAKRKSTSGSAIDFELLKQLKEDHPSWSWEQFAPYFHPHNAKQLRTYWSHNNSKNTKWTEEEKDEFAEWLINDDKDRFKRASKAFGKTALACKEMAKNIDQ